MQNPNSSYVGYGSYVGPYQLRSIGGKGVYKLATTYSYGGSQKFSSSQLSHQLVTVAQIRV